MTDLKNMTMKQLVEFHNSLRTALPSLPEITVTTYKSKQLLINHLETVHQLRPKTIARLLNTDAYNVRMALRDAQNDGRLSNHTQWKHWRLTPAQFLRVFGGKGE